MAPECFAIRYTRKCDGSGVSFCWFVWHRLLLSNQDHFYASCISFGVDESVPALELNSTKAASVQYDTDVTTWSPQGRLHQVEYAMEAVKQGSAAVGLKVQRSLLFRPASSSCLVHVVEGDSLKQACMHATWVPG